MDTLKKVVVCSAVLVTIAFAGFIYALRDKLPNLKEAHASGPPFEWLAVTNGETRQQLALTLGAPSEQSGSNVDVWRKGNGILRVTYGEDGRATNVWREGAWTLTVPINENKHPTNAVNQTILK